MTVVAFDFDGTLADSEMTAHLAARKGVEDRMTEITERAMRGELDYAESLRRRVALLSGLDEDDLAAAFEHVTLRPGAAAVIDAVRAAGNDAVVLTGGFERGVRQALAAGGVEVDGLVANRLSVVDGRLTGDVSGPLVEGTKDDALRRVAAERGHGLEETVAVGDGANDVPMLEVAGLPVGFDPKPGVGEAADVTVETMAELRTVLAERGVF
ncbi:MAG: phosphoserine phosphatase SerB [Halobacteriales archaeon]